MISKIVSDLNVNSTFVKCVRMARTVSFLFQDILDILERMIEIGHLSSGIFNSLIVSPCLISVLTKMRLKIVPLI